MSAGRIDVDTVFEAAMIDLVLAQKVEVAGMVVEARAAVAELVDRAQHLVICHSNGVLIERDVEDLRAALTRVTGGAS